ncbi:hypothetical protein KPLM21_820126 [Klebsiella pneumoniae]|nr:hypothetical protein KPLM21_820126 [Klebsiella pneumoniae]
MAKRPHTNTENKKTAEHHQAKKYIVHHDYVSD